MPVNISLGSAIKAAEKAVEDAYAQGFKDGHAAAIQHVVASVGQMAVEASVSTTPIVWDEDESSPSNAVRAPRGALDPVLEKVLSERPGMTQAEVEEAVLAADPRIAVKSVYNRLRAHEKAGVKYARLDGLWYPIRNIPPPWGVKRSPQGETEGVAPSASADPFEKAARLTVSGGGT